MDPNRADPWASESGATFERFVVSASPRLLRVAFLLTGDRGHAEDLLQTALLRTLGRWPDIAAAPDAYVLEVLVNLSRDRLRRLRRRPAEALGPDIIERAGTDEAARLTERDALEHAAGALPRRQREVVALRFFLDLSVAETASAMRCSEGAVKSYTASALTRMRDLLDQPAVSRIDEAPAASPHRT